MARNMPCGQYLTLPNKETQSRGVCAWDVSTPGHGHRWSTGFNYPEPCLGSPLNRNGREDTTKAGGALMALGE